METAFVSMRLSCSLVTGGGGGHGVAMGWRVGNRGWKERGMEQEKKGEKEVKERKLGVEIQRRSFSVLWSSWWKLLLSLPNVSKFSF
jgi:hypothetical protein